MSRSLCAPVLTLIAAALLVACACKPGQEPVPEAKPTAWARAASPNPPAISRVQACRTQLGDAHLNPLIGQALAVNAAVRVIAACLERASQTRAKVTLAPRAQWLIRIELSSAAAPEMPVLVIERWPDVAGAWQRVLAAHPSAALGQ